MITKRRREGRDEGVGHFSTVGKRVYSLAPETVAPRGCTTLLCSSCCFCCWTPQEGSQSLKVASNSTVTDGDACMAPSAPVPLPPPPPPPPPVASAAAAAAELACDGINGHSQVPTVKLPGKSNLKQSSPSANSASNEARVSRPEEHVANAEPGEEYTADVVVTEPEKRDCKVQWMDNFGKDLTQVHEFEPSDSGDSEDDDDDGDSSQSCTCVIQ